LRPTRSMPKIRNDEGCSLLARVPRPLALHHPPCVTRRAPIAGYAVGLLTRCYLSERMGHDDDLGPASGVATRSPSHRAAVLSVAALSCVLALVFGIGSRDDPYITFWVAEQFAKSGRLININGASIEQSSSLAHVMVLAALYFTTRAPLPVLAYGVGLAGLFATVLLSASLAGRVRAGTQLPTACVVALAFPVLYWATGELETDLAAAGVLWFLVSLHRLLTSVELRRWTVAGFVASSVLVVTVRPDTMIVALLVCLVVVAVALLGAARGGVIARVAPPLDLGRSTLALGAVAVAAGLLGLFRELVFRQLLPQPEIAKSGGLGWFTKGSLYVITSFPWWMWLVFVALLALGVRWSVATRSLAGCMAGATFVIGLLVMCFSRGDWMGGARLLVPYLAPGLVVMVAGAWSLRSTGRRLSVALLLAIECVTVILFANGASWLSPQSFAVSLSAESSSAADYGSFLGASYASSLEHPVSLPWYVDWSSITTRDAIFLSVATPKLRALIQREPPGHEITVASNQAGMVFYTWANEFPGKLRFIDMDSLTTNDFASCHNLVASYSGELMTIDRWAFDAGSCAPPLPDLYFSTARPATLTRQYHVISSLWTKYARRGISATHSVLGTEFLAQRNGWSP